jgi:hypothetical protein
MARATVIHSDDAVQISFYGNPRKPEPSTAVIKFPGGHVEVARCSDGTYWAHVEVVAPENVSHGRIDYAHGGDRAVRELPEGALVKKLAINIANVVPHPDWEAA